MLANIKQQYLTRCKVQNIPFDLIEPELVKSNWSPAEIIESRKFFQELNVSNIRTSTRDLHPSLVTDEQNKHSNLYIYLTSHQSIIQRTILYIILTLASASLFYLFVIALSLLIITNKLPIGISMVKQAANHVILNAPLPIQNPAITLAKAEKNSQDITSSNYDLQLKISSTTLREYISKQDITINISGYIDASDSKNIIYDSDINIEQLGNLQYRQIGDQKYFKIDEIPKIITDMHPTINYSQVNSQLINWIKLPQDQPIAPPISEQQLQNFSSSFDTNKLDKELAEMDQMISKRTEETIQYIQSPEVLNQLTLKKTTLDNQDSYLIHADITPIIVQKMQNIIIPELTTKLNSYIKNLQLSIWIDQKSHYYQKFVLAFDIIHNKTDNSEYTEVALIAKLSNQNKPQDIQPPTKSISAEDLLDRINQATPKNTPTIFNSHLYARDNVRQQDILMIKTAVEQFAILNQGDLPHTSENKFPQTSTCIGSNPDCFDLNSSGNLTNNEKFIPDYLAKIPADPSTGTPENTNYYIHVSPKGEIIITATGEIIQNITTASTSLNKSESNLTPIPIN